MKRYPCQRTPDGVRSSAGRIRRLTDHREQVTARNPKTGRLITLWQVKFGQGDDCPMGVAVMSSGDQGVAVARTNAIYTCSPAKIVDGGSLVWNPAGNDGRGEFLLSDLLACTQSGRSHHAVPFPGRR